MNKEADTWFDVVYLSCVENDDGPLNIFVCSASIDQNTVGLRCNGRLKKIYSALGKSIEVAASKLSLLKLSTTSKISCVGLFCEVIANNSAFRTSTRIAEMSRCKQEIK